MSKINQFTFSNDPKYIFNEAISAGYQCYYENIREEYVFVFSTENEAFATYMHDNYKIRYFSKCGFNRKNLFGYEGQTAPYGMVYCNDVFENAYYRSINAGIMFADTLTEKFGIECHIISEDVMFRSGKLKHYKGIDNEQYK